MIKDYLPIGSVVILKGGIKPVMIFGYKQIDSSDETKEYDYAGVLYPEGHIGPDFQYLFDHTDIEKTLYKGYEASEFKEFIDKVSKAYEE